MDNMDLNIGFALPVWRGGFGIENRVQNLINFVPANKKRIFCLESGRPVPAGAELVMPPKINLRGVPSLIVQGAGYKFMRYWFARHMRDLDVIDAQYFPMTELRKDICPFVTTWHSVTFMKYAQAGEAPHWRLARRRMLSAARDSDLAIAVSKWAEREIKEFDSSIKTAVVPNGVDLEDFFFKSLDHRGRNLISVGRFTPHKNHETTLLLFKEVAKEYPQSKLILAGSAPDENCVDALKNLAAALGIQKRVVFLTDAPDWMLPKVYHLGDVFVSCSMWEGFGMPLLEAQACGLPAFAFDICSHPEVVADKKNLFAPSDVYGMAERIKSLFGDKEDYTSSAIGARRFAESFDWRSVAALYEKTVKNL